RPRRPHRHRPHQTPDPRPAGARRAHGGEDLRRARAGAETAEAENPVAWVQKIPSPAAKRQHPQAESPMSPDKIFLVVDGRRMSLTDLMAERANAEFVYARGCTGLTALPDLPNAEFVYASGCTG